MSSRGSAARLAGITAHDTQDLIADVDQGCLVGRLDVEPEQRLGVRRAQVEPPAVAIYGQPVQLVHPTPPPPREGRPARRRARALAPTLAVISPDPPVPGEFRDRRGRRPSLR